MVLFPWLVSLKKSMSRMNRAQARNKRRALHRPESLEPRALLAATFTEAVTAAFATGGVDLVVTGDTDTAELYLRVNSINNTLEIVDVDDAGLETVQVVAADPGLIESIEVDVSAYTGAGTATGVWVDLTGLDSSVAATIDGLNPNFDLTIEVTGSTLSGAGEGDTIRGSDFNELIFAGDGDDEVDSHAGFDTIFGGDGADTLDAGLHSDVIYGGDGVDVIGGDANEGGIGSGVSGGADTIYGEAGADIISGDAGNDSIMGGQDGDIIDGGIGSDFINGEDGTDNINGGDGNDVIFGGNEAPTTGDTILGGEGNDLVYAGLGDDSVEGGNGNDTVNGGVGNDTVAGGTFDADAIAYVDRVSGENGTDFLVWYAGASTSIMDGGIGNDTMVVMGTDQGDALLIDQAATGLFRVTLDTLGAARSTLTTENIIVLGGDGDDGITLTANLSASTAGRTLAIFGGNGNDTIDLSNPAGVNGFSLTNFSTSNLYGGQGNDTITGSAAKDTIYGDRGLVDDTDLASLDFGVNPLQNFTGDDTSPRADGTFGDDLSGLAGNDTIVGGDDDDIISGGAGNDVLGSEGVDTDGNDTERGNDTIVGDAGNDLIDGGDGNDSSLDGGAGNDSVDGGDDDDTIFGGVGNDTVFGGSGNDVVNGDAGNDRMNTVLGVEDDGDDTLDGGIGNDIIEDDVGSNSLLGGDGNDVITAGGTDDTTVSTVQGGAGNDVITSTVGSDILYGGNEDGSSVANAAGVIVDNDVITGGDGDDSITGGEGNDRLSGDIQGVVLGDADTLGGNDTIRGGIGNDSVYGGVGNDLITGGAGADKINGGLGNDEIYGDYDTAFGLADPAETFYTTEGGGAPEVATDGADIIKGGNGNDTIFAGGGNDKVTGDNNVAADRNNVSTDDGAAGRDYISGGSGNDTLAGGGGNDKIEGDAGADKINGEDGDDHVNAFTYVDFTGLLRRDLFGVADPNGELDASDDEDLLTTDALGNAVDDAVVDTVAGNGGADVILKAPTDKLAESLLPAAMFSITGIPFTA